MIRHNSKGFTLIELLVVLAILGMIAAFSAPRVFKYLGGAKVDAAKIQIESLSSALDLYKLENGSYPEQLTALVEKPADAARWNGPYLKKKTIPKDPWGREYQYRYPAAAGSYELMSLGADGAAGGDGDNSDVYNWQ